jgi:hypothetical protein
MKSLLVRSTLVAAFLALLPTLVAQTTSTTGSTSARNAGGVYLTTTESPTTRSEQQTAANEGPTAKANTFLDSLNQQQKDKALLPYDSENRVQWHFIPMATRKGLPLMEMSPSQQATALELLKSCVSPDGFQKAQEIMELEKLLKALEGQGGRMERNPVKYYFTVFGRPASDSRWALSIEGHHLSLNFVFQGDRVVDSTPQFFAANPARIQSDQGNWKKGNEVLEAEQRLGRQLAESLTDQQKSMALLPGETPTEILSAATAQPPHRDPVGLPVDKLSPAQKDLLVQLLTAYTSKMNPWVAQHRWELIQAEGWQNVYFGWSGGLQPGQGHYYVIQGPTFLVEFINVQPDAAGNPANHIHCVWRDMTGDFDLPIR